MNRTPSIIAIRALGLLALIAVTPVPAGRGVDADSPKAPPGTIAPDTTPDAAPIVLAQGRCFNGRCF